MLRGLDVVADAVHKWVAERAKVEEASDVAKHRLLFTLAALGLATLIGAVIGLSLSSGI